MLTEEQVKTFAVKGQSSIINVAREYIQNLFLSIFYSFEESGSIYFKGGTALRILYRSPRFSEDLDFSTARIERNKIEHLLQETMIGLDKEGLEVDISESSVTTGGYFGQITCRFGQERMPISLEIFGRKKAVSGQIIMVDNPYIPAYSLMALKRDSLISEKVDALLSRKKPRDFYDLYFMLRADLLPQKRVLKEIYPLVQSTKIDFKQELLEFLPQGQHRIIKDFKNILVDEIKRYIA